MKKLLIAIILFFITIFVTAFLLPKDFRLESSIEINRPIDEVFNYVRMLENGREWQVFSAQRNLKEEISGQDGQVGSVLKWSAPNNVGEQEITNIVRKERVDFELRFKEPMQGNNKGYYVVESMADSKTKVTWGMEGRTKFPFNIVCFFMRKQVVQDFSDSLKELKIILEKNNFAQKTVSDKSQPNVKKE